MISMKDIIEDIVSKYLEIYPLENDRQKDLIDFIDNYESEDLIDWNNFDAHLVASGYIYAKKEQKFLTLYHNDLKLYLYPGGHIDDTDSSIIDAAKREIKEETGLSDLKLVKVHEDELVPFDIDEHYIGYNERLNLPSHRHFDFRYFFVIDHIEEVVLDGEMSGYHWVDFDFLKSNDNYLDVIEKLENILLNL